MPARVVLPRNLGSFGKDGDDQQTLSFDAKLRRAASKVLSQEAGASVDDDLLEAIACQACDIFDSHESKQTERTTIREAYA
eukprot:s884_g9.t1